MSVSTKRQPPQVIVQRKDVQALFDALASRGYDVLGPTIQDNAIIYGPIAAVDELPIGWVEKQDKGTYRLVKHELETLFGYVVGPHSWKKFLYPSSRKVLSAKRNGKSFEVSVETEAPRKQAFIGVRACELQAMAIHDKILASGEYIDPAYRRQREQTFVVAVNCARSAGTCFCASMKTGPRAADGYDLVLTEVIDANRHLFVVEAGSDAGMNVLKDVPHKEAKKAEVDAADKAVSYTASHMKRKLDTRGLPDLLKQNFDNAHWQTVGARCLTCGNCTLVCPTCFCMNVQDSTDLTGATAERCRAWDSCFTVDFAYIHGGSLRASTMSRYRQWMMHKLAYWPEQFGTFGCVGCGRCITWCPVGIDITEEARAIRSGE
jgi:sulfhydrogenase subunit beta (sulfur reductase)